MIPNSGDLLLPHLCVSDFFLSNEPKKIAGCCSFVPLLVAQSHAPFKDTVPVCFKFLRPFHSSIHPYFRRFQGSPRKLITLSCFVFHLFHLFPACVNLFRVAGSRTLHSLPQNALTQGIMTVGQPPAPWYCPGGCNGPRPGPMRGGGSLRDEWSRSALLASLGRCTKRVPNAIVIGCCSTIANIDFFLKIY